ncbi:MAG TPA: ABC transporter substrate-binding protein [Alphaproteobacteria bacterium]|nr:ABC transporter substrate-binding protein [Alphaproteobacteria bacterium]
MRFVAVFPRPWALLSLALATALGLAAAPVARAAEYDINVVLPLSGGAAFVGQGQRAVLDALAAQVNKTGGIDGDQLKFLFHDDQTSPQVAVQLTNEILPSHPTVVIGSSLVGMCLAMAPLMKEGPVQYCMSPAIHPKPGGYIFSASCSSIDQIAAVMRYYRMMGWTKLAVMNTTDASGQDGDRAVDEVLNYPENKGVMKKVIQEHFNPTDISVAAQIARIKASGAQALIAWTTGAPAGTVFKGMVQAGLDIPVAPTSGNQTFAAMKAWSSFLPKHVILASALYPPHAGVLTLDPRIEKAQAEMYAILKERGLKADNQVATSWDAGLIVVAGLRKLGLKATPAQLRDFIANLTDFAGVDGIYNFKKYPERGLGPLGSTVTTYDPKTESWVWLAKPGGEPIGK